MKQTLIYLISVITIYTVSFSVAHFISRIMELLRIKKEKNIIKENNSSQETNEKDVYEVTSILYKIKQKQIRYDRNCFYISIVLILLFISLVVFAFLTNGISLKAKYLCFLYFVLPIVSFNIMNSGFDYFKENYLIKKNETKKYNP